MARPYRPRRWQVAEPDPAICQRLMTELAVSPITAQILCNRGLTDPAAAREFLESGRERLHDPFLLRDMDRAVTLLRERVQQRRPVVVYGDYDVDGVTGTAILVGLLRRLRVPVEYYIPNRFTEGYGLNSAALEALRQGGHDFVLTVDTGISALAEARRARELGITLVVTDHHEPGPVLPDAAAVVNPKRADCPYPFKGLSGAGVAFKLAQALAGPDPAVWEWLEIVALATVADLVPLTGENRSLVKEGLAQLTATRRPGLQALKRVAGLAEDGSVSATQIAFSLGPRINALGRLGDARLGVELLLTDDPDRAAELARHLDAENTARQEIQEQMRQQAMELLAAQAPHEKEFAVVLGAEGWHHGVVGICAAKVVEAVYRPTILLAIEGDEARGSARSIPGFHMFRALQACSDLLIKFGGHAMAAGMTLRAADLPRLRERLNQIARDWLTEDDLVPKLPIDGWVRPEQISAELVAELARLEPYGLGNPGPRLAVPALAVADARPVGQDKRHLKLRFRDAAGGTLDGIGFGLCQPGAPGEVPPAPGSAWDVAFVPELNHWNGTTRIQLRMEDLQPAGHHPLGVDSWQAEAARCMEPAALDAWDPLAGLDEGAGSIPLAPWPALGAEPAAAGPAGSEAAVGEAEAGPPDAPATRAEQVAALAAAAGGPILVLTGSPWAMARAAAPIRASLRPLGGAVRLWVPGQPPPRLRAGQPAAVVAAWGGCDPGQGSWGAVVAWHPPYHPAQAAEVPAPAFAAWSPAEWSLAEVTLSWPYPGREELVRLWRLLRAAAGPVSVAQLVARVVASGQEPAGVWNRLRVQSGTAIFAELGLLGGLVDDRLHILDAVLAQRGKMNLEDSARFRRGLQGRTALRRCHAALAGAGCAISLEP